MYTEQSQGEFYRKSVKRDVAHPLTYGVGLGSKIDLQFVIRSATLLCTFVPHMARYTSVLHIRSAFPFCTFDLHIRSAPVHIRSAHSFCMNALKN